jgi:hypothetical protein
LEVSVMLVRLNFLGISWDEALELMGNWPVPATGCRHVGLRFSVAFSGTA